MAFKRIKPCRLSRIWKQGIAALLIAGFFAVGTDSLQAQSAGPGVDSCANPPNPVVAENCRPGTNRWQISYPAEGIEGFTSSTSVNPGETIEFFVNTAASRFDLLIYRSGYYGGAGGRLVQAVYELPGQPQPACHSEPDTGLLSCSNWAASYSLAVPDNWVSGVYLAKLSTTPDGSGKLIPFVVRDDSRDAEILFQLSVTTYQAYNGYGGKALYSTLSPDRTLTVAETPRAVKISFDRPSVIDFGPNTYLYQDYPMVYWLEAQGYDVSYITNLDTHRAGEAGSPNDLLNHWLFLSVGHDEYWSRQMREAVTEARDSGVHLGFFSSNVSYWRVRFEPDPWSHEPDRVMVCYKTTESGPADPGGQPTGTWRDPAGANAPENGLVGSQYIGDNDARYFPLRVTAEQARDSIYRHTGLQQLPLGSYVDLGQELVGWEWDAVVDNGHTPAGLTILAASPTYGALLADAGRSYTLGPADAHVTRYTAPSGAIVFASGTNQWSWGLALVEPNRRLQQITANLLADMGLRPATPAATLVLDENAPAEPAGSPVNGVSFRPEGDTAAPQISNLQVSASDRTATISWQTGEPATGQVWIKAAPGPIDYRLPGLSAQLPVSQWQNPIASSNSRKNYAQSHHFTVTRLNPGTIYYYHVASAAAGGRAAISAENSFQTDGSLFMQIKMRLRPAYYAFIDWMGSGHHALLSLIATLFLIAAAGLAGWYLRAATVRRGS